MFILKADPERYWGRWCACEAGFYHIDSTTWGLFIVLVMWHLV